MNIDLKHGDCIQILRGMESNSVGSIICDPPYDLVGNSRNGSPQPGDQSTPYGRSGPSKSKGFMGKGWDGTGIAFGQELWGEIYRVLKPNGVVKAFGGTRTFHKMARAMATSGLEDLRVEAWCYGSGFPKSMDISKQLDKKAGVEPKVVGFKKVTRLLPNDVPFGQGLISETPVVGGTVDVTEPVSEEAQQWNGWGTALKPAWEPVVVGRKP